MKLFIYFAVILLLGITAVQAQEYNSYTLGNYNASYSGCNLKDVIDGNPNLSTCKNLCETICGTGYTNAEIRQFYQTKKNGMTCLNTTENPSLASASCDERHGTSATWGQWCVQYNKFYEGIDLGMQWQCVGLIRKN